VPLIIDVLADHIRPCVCRPTERYYQSTSTSVNDEIGLMNDFVYCRIACIAHFRRRFTATRQVTYLPQMHTANLRIPIKPMVKVTGQGAEPRGVATKSGLGDDGNFFGSSPQFRHFGGPNDQLLNSMYRPKDV